MPDVSTLKRSVKAAGLEVYRTIGTSVHIAERIRVNLILDSGISIDAANNTVTVAVRAQQTAFPQLAEDEIAARLQDLAMPIAARGFSAGKQTREHVEDPNDAGETIDTWIAIPHLQIFPSVDDAISEVAALLLLDRVLTSA